MQEQHEAPNRQCCCSRAVLFSSWCNGHDRAHAAAHDVVHIGVKEIDPVADFKALAMPGNQR
jgi:hypothetical protein